MTFLPGSRLLRMPGLFCAVLCQLMQQRRVGCALNPAARVEDQTGTGRCDLREQNANVFLKNLVSYSNLHSNLPGTYHFEKAALRSEAYAHR